MSDCLSKLVVGVLAFRGTGALKFFAALTVLAGIAGVGFERWTAWQLTVERQLLETRAIELVTRAMTPGSALACLDAVGNGAFEEGCEKALFASPERTAAAVSYVSAQLSLLAAGKDYSRRAGRDYGLALAQLRRNAEWDGFGVVAHVLAMREGCTPTSCAALAVLNSPQRVRINLAQSAFDAKVTRYAIAWSTAHERNDLAQHAEPAQPADQVATAGQPAPAASPRTPNNYFFPSANSIPAVSIMTPEPDDPSAGRPSGRKPVPAEATAARKPAARATASVNPDAGSAATPANTTAPMPLAPMALAPGGR